MARSEIRQYQQNRPYMLKGDYTFVIFEISIFLKIVQQVFPFNASLIAGAYFITIRYRPEETSEVPIILRPRSEETMMKWYNTLQELHRKCIEVDGELQNSGSLDSSSFQRQTQFYTRDKSMSFSSRSGYASKFDGRIDVHLHSPHLAQDQKTVKTMDYDPFQCREVQVVFKEI